MSLPSNSDIVNRVVAMRPALVRRAAFLLGARAHIGTPEDFAQDAIVVALQSLDGFTDESLSGWMTAILQYCIRNAARRAHVKTSVSLYRPETAGDDSADAIEFPVAATQGERLELADVMEALNKLSAADQVGLPGLKGFPTRRLRKGFTLRSGLFIRVSHAQPRACGMSMKPCQLLLLDILRLVYCAPRRRSS